MKHLKLLKLPILGLFIIILAGCGKETSNKISDISVPQWQAMSIQKKAETYLKSKYNASKVSQNNANLLHIQTLVSLSPPLTREEWSQFELAKIKLLKEHPNWGDWQKELVIYSKKLNEFKKKDTKTIYILMLRSRYRKCKIIC
jgi:hypothetical protein